MTRTITALLVIANLTLNAQNKSTTLKQSPPIITDIEKVAGDYFNHFDNIKGEKISETTSIIEYASMVNPAGALESTVMQIKTLENCYSWQALMLDTEDYNQAVAKYKLLYKQLVGSRLSFGDGQYYKLAGMYDTPDDARRFASSLVAIESNNVKFRQFRIEVELNYSMPEWSVKLYLYEKENDDEIRPSVNSDY